jgi:predicted ATP-dependent Lon-type protease
LILRRSDARRLVLIPTTNAGDLGKMPAELLDKLRVDVYSEPSQAAFKALSE